MMVEHKELMADPRIVRTRQLLFSALDDLLSEKRFREISVSDLARRAKIGRQTFYRHFESIADMLEVRLRSNLADQIELAKANMSTEEAANWSMWVTRFAFERIAEQPNISRAILSGEAGSNALASFREQIIALNANAPEDVKAHTSPPELQNYVSSFHAGAISAFLLHWIESDCVPDAETMSRLFTLLSDTAHIDWQEAKKIVK